MPPSRIITGASAKLYINGKPYALVNSFNFSVSYVTKENRGLDFPLPFEIAPGMVSVTGQLSLERLAGKGGAKGAGLTVSLTDISRQKYCSILLIERQTRTTIFKADFCMTSNESWGVAVKGRLQGTLDVKCIGFTDDFGSGVPF